VSLGDGDFVVRMGVGEYVRRFGTCTAVDRIPVPRGGMMHTAPPAALRRRLFGVAYRMTGSVSDAEDLVQDVLLTWTTLPQAEIAHPQAYLTTAVVRRAQDLLKSARRRRERYVGPWLPEPLVTDAPVATGADDALATAESVQIGMLLLLERLTPAQRAVLVLKDAVGMPFDAIAATLATSEAACRKQAQRARRVLAAAATDASTPTPMATAANHASARAATDAFLHAAGGGDVDALVATLLEDAQLISDGGGKAKAALQPISGARRVARFVLGVVRARSDEALVVTQTWLNGCPGVLLRGADGVNSALVFDVDAAGRVRTVYIVRNPDKLGHLQAL
jgi:RNA polymerase sigma-70 factor (ECF subfamily)